MKRILKVIMTIIGTAAIIVAAAFAYRYVQQRSKPVEQKNTTGPVKVGVATVRVGKVAQTVWVTGEVHALDAVDVTSELSGRLERLRLPDGTLVEEGVNVRKGDVVAIIERDRYETAVRTAEAAVAVAKAAFERAKVNLGDARREKDRWTRLVADGAGTQQQLDKVVTAFERAQAEFELAQAQVKQAEAALEQAKVNLEETTIEAPFSGVVSRKYVDEGAFVGPTMPLFRLVDIHEVEITGGVADRHYPKIKIGKTRAEVEVDAYPQEKFSGFISRLRPELDRVTRTVAVTIRVPNHDGRLKPGMYARIKLILDEHNKVPIVPDEALLAFEDGTRVYVVNGGEARLRKVRIGLEEGHWNEVLDGLQAGEVVVVRGKEMLRDGTAVEPQEVDAQ